MRCLNCGASTRPVHEDSHYFCRHCDTHHLPAGLKISTDGVVTTGEEINYHCPTCDGSRLVAGWLDESEIGFCQSCHGILIVGAALSQVLTDRRQQANLREDTAAPVNQVELQRKIGCPVCEFTMEVHPYYGPGNAVIDSCFRCGLIWLDHGEVKVLEHAPGR